MVHLVLDEDFDHAPHFLLFPLLLRFVVNQGLPDRFLAEKVQAVHLLGDLEAIGAGHSKLSESDFFLEQGYLDFTKGQYVLNFSREVADVFLQVHGNGVLLVADLVKDLLNELVGYEVLGEVCLSSCDLDVLGSLRPLSVSLKLVTLCVSSVLDEN